MNHCDNIGSLSKLKNNYGACDRKNCENIMCDNHIPNIGYMCYECEAEFVKNFSGNLTERAIKSALTTFMFSKKKLQQKREYK